MNISNNLVQLFQYIDSLGTIQGVVTFAKVKLRMTDQMRLHGITHPFRLRSGTSDISAFRQVFVFREYEFSVVEEPRFILDGGSNVGLAAIYFANQFPNATIVSVEPEARNFALLKENVENYAQIHPVESGLWGTSTWLRVKDIGLGNWGFVVEETGPGEPGAFRALSISDLMLQFQMPHLDIVKLDVEGAEREILTHDADVWLSKTKILVIELHDRLKKGCSRALFRALLEYDFLVEQRGENLVCTRA